MLCTEQYTSYKNLLFVSLSLSLNKSYYGIKWHLGEKWNKFLDEMEIDEMNLRSTSVIPNAPGWKEIGLIWIDLKDEDMLEGEGWI